MILRDRFSVPAGALIRECKMRPFHYRCLLDWRFDPTPWIAVVCSIQHMVVRYTEYNLKNYYLFVIFLRYTLPPYVECCSSTFGREFEAYHSEKEALIKSRPTYLALSRQFPVSDWRHLSSFFWLHPPWSDVVLLWSPSFIASADENYPLPLSCCFLLCLRGISYLCF